MEEKRQLQNQETYADEHFLIFIRKKAERMVTALYFVTDLLSEKEPLKWSLRQTCVTMFGELLSHVRQALTSRDAEIIVRRVSEISSLLQVAESAQLLSEMNARLLREACGELKRLLGELSEQSELSDRMFEVPELRHEGKDNKQKQKDINDISMANTESFSTMSHRKSPAGEEVSPDRTERQHKICALLQEKGTSMMSDIKAVISDVSDKTLQRDIADLVEAGTIVRSGSKRWTNYRLT